MKSPLMPIIVIVKTTHNRWTTTTFLASSRLVVTLGMKADRIGLDNTFTTSASIFFRIWSGADIARMWLHMRIFSDVRNGAESDWLRSGCKLIQSDNTCLYSISNGDK
jgi:hypothetical protein